MAIAIAQTKLGAAQSTTSAGHTASFTSDALTNAPTVGNQMFLAVEVQANNPTYGGTPSTMATPTGWTLIGEGGNQGAQNTYDRYDVYLFTKTVASGDTGAVSFTVNDPNYTGDTFHFQSFTYELSGVNTTTPVNQSSSASGTAASLTPTVVGTLPLAVGHTNGSNPTISGGWTLDDSGQSYPAIFAGHGPTTTDTTTAIACGLSGTLKAEVFILVTPGVTTQTYNASVSDTVATATSSVASARVMSGSGSDTFAFSSSQAQRVIAAITASDAFSFGQALAALVARTGNLSDRVMTLSEALSQRVIQLAAVAQRIATLSDTAATKVLQTSLASDTFTLGSSVSQATLAANAHGADTFNFGDVLTTAQIVQAAVADVMSFSSIVSGGTGAQEHIDQTFSFSDVVQGSIQMQTAVADALSFADSVKGELAANLGITQVGSFGSSVKAGIAQNGTAADTFTFAAAPAAAMAFQGAAADTIRLLDSLAAQVQQKATTLDRVATLSDSVRVQDIATALVSDLIHFADAITNALWLKWTAPLVLTFTVQKTATLNLTASTTATLSLKTTPTATLGVGQPAPVSLGLKIAPNTTSNLKIQ